MNIHILGEAHEELWQAANWYEEHERGVGMQFLHAYESALRSIQEQVESSSRIEHLESDRDIRRTRLRRFPYLIVYEHLREDVIILAVAHTSRRPSYWISRSRA